MDMRHNSTPLYRKVLKNKGFFLPFAVDFDRKLC